MGFQFLEPTDINRYNTAASNSRAQYARKIARGTYDMGQLNQDYNLGRAQLGQQWDEARRDLPGAFVKRGVFNSGIYQQGLQDYAQKRLGSFQQLGRQHQKQYGGLLQDMIGAETDLSTQLGQISADKEARRAQLAAAIKGIL